MQYDSLNKYVLRLFLKAVTVSVMQCQCQQIDGVNLLALSMHSWQVVVLLQYEPDQQTHTVHLVCSPSTTDASYTSSPQAQQQVSLSYSYSYACYIGR